MTAHVRIIDPGIAASVQDRGRPGWRRFGVPLSGVLDPDLASAANLLLDNPVDSAVIEVLLRGPTLEAVDRPVAIAWTGAMTADVMDKTGRSTRLPPWQGVRLAPGETLRFAAPKPGIAYIAISGGLRTALRLGSRSTYARAGFGDFLRTGDQLPCLPAGLCRSGRAWPAESGAIGLLPGPQQDHFTDAARAAMVTQTFVVAPQSDRMGLRLIGPALSHGPAGAETHTEGVVPGALQVPGDGQPILLLADAQTTGGYAKIAVVITADLSRLAHLRPGQEIRFAWRTRAEAKQALLTRQARLARWAADLQPSVTERLDLAALYQHNLISGAITGQGDESG